MKYRYYQILTNKSFTFTTVFLCTLLWFSSSAMAEVDHSLWGDLLTKHNHAGSVDYNGMQADEAQLDAYLALLEKTNPASLERSEALAYYINLYNAWTVKLILSKYPNLKSIKDIGSLLKSPWKIELIPLNGKKVTLDHIEHDIIRPQFKDPRIHFAINCAALSCPPLRQTPFEGSTLDQQLDQATTQFINDPKSNYLKGKTLYLSRIFKWFNEDFNDGVGPFVRRYAQGDLKTALETLPGGPSIKYLKYDWSLNSI
jgi:hypothetical protein